MGCCGSHSQDSYKDKSQSQIPHPNGNMTEPMHANNKKINGHNARFRGTLNNQDHPKSPKDQFTQDLSDLMMGSNGLNGAGQNGGHLVNGSDLTSQGKSKLDTTTDHPLYKGGLALASRLFYEEKYADAAEIFKRHLEKKREASVSEIDGLGQGDLSQGYYQWFLFRWYKEGIEDKTYVGTAYDALSLCHLALKNNAKEIVKGIKWYQSMIDYFPENHGLLMGYANILNNNGSLEEALGYYLRVAEMKPDWVRPLQCMALIYEFTQIDKKLSCEKASQLLTIEPDNRVGLFVLAHNEHDIDKRILILKQIKEKHSRYGRGFNEIGIVYADLKSDSREACSWYKKATEVSPGYLVCYNNVGLMYKGLNEHEDAIVWFFKGIQQEKEYKAYYKNLGDLIDDKNLTEASIEQHLSKSRLAKDQFYYNLGISYHDKKDQDIAIKYFNKAYDCLQGLQKDIHKLHNSMGCAYDEKRQTQNAVKYYTMSFEANRKYSLAYYNLARLQERQQEVIEATIWYQKAIKANLLYRQAHYHLAVIYRRQNRTEEAIKGFEKAVECCQTYTLAYVYLGVCYFSIGNLRESFNSMERAKESVMKDTDQLSEIQKKQIKLIVEKFDTDGEQLRLKGGITKEQASKLEEAIRVFEYSSGNPQFQNNRKVSRNKVLRPEVLEIVRLVDEDQFELWSCNRVCSQVIALFEDNEEYFHILPQLFIQYFIKNVFTKNLPILQIEKQLLSQIKNILSNKPGVQSFNLAEYKGKRMSFAMKHFNPPREGKMNLFKKDCFDNYQDLYNELMRVNEVAAQSYPVFKNLVDTVRKISFGTLHQIGMKIPNGERQQCQAIIHIFGRMFQKELTPVKIQQIITKIGEALKVDHKTINQHIGVGEVLNKVMAIWSNEITGIVGYRKKHAIPTKCKVGDLLKGKIMFDTVDHLHMAIASVDKHCNLNNYKVIEMDNRIAKKHLQDVVIKLQIEETVCELHLAIKKDKAQYHFYHCLEEIERSPLGCIFGSYAFISKGVQYSFLQNCQDITKELKSPQNQMEERFLQAAKYIVENLNPKTEAKS